MTEDRSYRHVPGELANILKKVTFDDGIHRRLKEENQQLKQIADCLSWKIERAKTSGNASTEPDLHAEYELLASRNNTLRAQLGSVRAAFHETGHSYMETRDSVHFFEVVQQSLRRKLQGLLIDLKEAELMADMQSGERDDLCDEIDYMHRQRERARQEIENLNRQNMNLMRENAQMRERLGEPEQQENQESPSVLRKVLTWMCVCMVVVSGLPCDRLVLSGYSGFLPQSKKVKWSL